MTARRRWTHYPITTRELEVLRVEQVTPGMRRVTLGGPGLAAHTAPSGYPVQAFCSDGFDDEFKLFLRHPEEPAALVPQQKDGVLEWPRHPHLVSRTYTVRRWDAAAGELDVDLVLHGHGPAAAWAQSVCPGERVQVAGPKMSGGLPEDCDWVLVLADETGLPAVARWLDTMVEPTAAHVYIEVAHTSHRQSLRVPDGVEITWLPRDGAPAGTGNLLLEAAQALDWPPGEAFAWAAGEAQTLAPIRRWLRREKGLEKDAVDVTGYWRRPTERPASHQAEASSADSSGPDVHDMGEIARPLALRVALTVGLGEALLEPTGFNRLVALTRCDRHALKHLLRYLDALGLLSSTEKAGEPQYQWGEQMRAGMADEWLVDQWSLDGARGRAALDVLGLLGVLRGAGPPDPADLDRVLSVARTSPSERVRQQVAEQDAAAVYLADPLARSSLVTGCRSIRVSGHGAGQVARELRRQQPHLEVRLLAPPAEAAVQRERLLGLGVQVEDDGIHHPSAASLDLHVWVDQADQLSDEDLPRVLRRSVIATGGGRVLLVGESLDPGDLDEHECEEGLVRLAAGGAGLRTAAERDAVLRTVGLPLQDGGTVGWGFDVRVIG